MSFFSNKVAVVTGAASGIGKALFQNLAAVGARLAVSDINIEALNAVAAAMNISSENLLVSELDTSDKAAIYKHRDDVLAKYGKVDIVINNAGVALDTIGVNEIKDQDFEWVMDINFWGMVHGTKAFLPSLLQNNNQTALVNISSVFGFVGIGYQAAYCSSKFAIRGFTESLRMEMHQQERKVKVISVHPGGIQTNIARSSRATDGRTYAERKDQIEQSEKMFITTPDDAAKTILKGIKQGKERLLIGPDARQLSWMYRLFPTKYTDILLKRFKKEQLFDGIDDKINVI